MNKKGIFRVILDNINNTPGSICMEYPSPYFQSGTPFDFSAGSQILGEKNLQQWGCGSCGVIQDNSGFAIGVRKVGTDNKIKIDFLELKKHGEKWKAPRINPNNYREIHYQNLQPVTLKLEWEQDGVKKIIGQKDI